MFVWRVGMPHHRHDFELPVRRIGSNRLNHKQQSPTRRARLYCLYGAPDTIRTCDRLVRSQVLYPAELRALKGAYYRGQAILSQGLGQTWAGLLKVPHGKELD
jgi:hypothetical protein